MKNKIKKGKKIAPKKTAPKRMDDKKSDEAWRKFMKRAVNPTPDEG
jgi:hypothetical protein